jgi:hypothetical protein
MSQEKTHDLKDFMRQLSDEMAAEYIRIQKRATEDPGTAGDQGEENWAELLRGWLPRTYEVVTKGRIIGQDGRTSPQVDVLVLKSIYPKQLIEEGQKIFLAAGVAAAFECKTTLKAEHIEQAVKTCAEVKNLYPAREGTPYKELHAPIVYGLLAHSHSWKGPNSTPEDNIRQKLLESDRLHVLHPRECVDMLCIADFGTWISGKLTFIYPSPSSVSDGSSLNQWRDFQYVLEGAAQTTYVRHTRFHDKQTKNFTPIGTLISNLSRRLAWEDVALRDLVDYYQITKIGGVGMGGFRDWPISIYSQDVINRIKSSGLLSKTTTWDEWQIAFNIH